MSFSIWIERKREGGKEGGREGGREGRREGGRREGRGEGGGEGGGGGVGGVGNPRFLPAVKPCWVCLPCQHKSVDHSSAEHGLPGTGNDVLC